MHNVIDLNNGFCVISCVDFTLVFQGNYKHCCEYIEQHKTDAFKNGLCVLRSTTAKRVLEEDKEYKEVFEF